MRNGCGEIDVVAGRQAPGCHPKAQGQGQGEGKQKHGEHRNLCKPGPLPKGATRVDRMKRKLQTKVGKAVYAARKSVVEPVFGHIKQARGFRQFLLRGLKKIAGEWALVCMTHNILRVYAALQA